MPDDKKPPPFPQQPTPRSTAAVHRDYSAIGRKTPVHGVKPIKIEAQGADRGDPTPTPTPGSISNEDLAVQVRNVDKKHDDFATTTTARLTIVEERTARIPSIDTKVDKLLLMSAEREQKRDILTMDLTKVHAHLESKEKEAEIEQKTLVVRDEKDEAAHQRKMKNRFAAIVSTIVGLLATLATTLAHHC